MKKIKLLCLSVLSASVLMTSISPAWAVPRERGYDYPTRHEHGRADHDRRDHGWRIGFILPQHYRGESYQVDYRQAGLDRPSAGTQWYRLKGEYVLVDMNSFKIVQIVEQ
ncbi:MAG: RcnB family protein [Acinetobacter sp.]|nr:RcnB family protein [Acinetobacter sp.]